MAKITDPDSLNQNTEVIFLTGSRRIQLLPSGNLTTDGATGQALYSFCKEEWKNDATLIKFPFPLIAITEQKFDLVNQWGLYDQVTKNLIRDAGWAWKDPNNASYEEYMGFISLGTVGATNQIYYQQTGSFSASYGSGTFGSGSFSNLVLTGSANQAIKIFGNAQSGNFNYRDFFKCFIRTPAKTYDQSSLSAIGQTTVTYQVYSFPLQNATDLKIANTGTFIDDNTPYTGMSIKYLSGSGFQKWANSTVYPAESVVSGSSGSFNARWFITKAGGTSAGTDVGSDNGGLGWSLYEGERSIGGTYYAFNRIIGGNNGLKQQIYEFVQHQLTKNADIDSGLIIVTGKTADKLLSFVGDTLVTSNGVYIDSYNTIDTNTIEFFDVNANKRTFPFVAAGTIVSNTNLTTDTNAVYKMFFANNFGNDAAILVNNNAGNSITGSLFGSASISFDFDYDNNSQGGRTPGTDADVTIVALGLSTGQYVTANGTIARSNANSISLVAALERNYTNP